MNAVTLLDQLRHQLVVSCQASPGSPFRETAIICAFAKAATQGGAAGLRIESLADVQAVRRQETVPIIGLIKRLGREVFITPELDDVRQLAAAGSNIVAFDATQRSRPASVPDLVAACHDHGVLAMADVSTAEEAFAARLAGADLVGTTLNGYTPYTRRGDGLERTGPDLELVRELSAAGVTVVAEGGIRTPEQARAALEAGAFAVVVGSAITRPDDVTRWFAQEIRYARPPA